MELIPVTAVVLVAAILFLEVLIGHALFEAGYNAGRWDETCKWLKLPTYADGFIAGTRNQDDYEHDQPGDEFASHDVPAGYDSTDELEAWGPDDRP